MQNTIAETVSFSGPGLHSGLMAHMAVKPAPVNHGIWFHRTDISGIDARVPALWSAVVSSPRCTMVENAAGVAVSTIEHLMAALAGCGIHNALIEIDTMEVPILDGSSAPFVEAFLHVGRQEQSQQVATIQVLQTVKVREGQASAWLEPSDALVIDFRIDFAESAIGQQSKSLNMANGAFVRELSDSRTFCSQGDVAGMRANGLALGGTVDNAVVFEDDRILSPGGLRHIDEPVRHKMLDALGDLALAGGPVMGRYTGIRAGHGLTNRLLRKLFATPGAWGKVPCSEMGSQRLPGVDLRAGDLPHRPRAALA